MRTMSLHSAVFRPRHRPLSLPERRRRDLKHVASAAVQRARSGQRPGVRPETPGCRTILRGLQSHSGDTSGSLGHPRACTEQAGGREALVTGAITWGVIRTTQDGTWAIRIKSCCFLSPYACSQWVLWMQLSDNMAVGGRTKIQGRSSHLRRFLTEKIVSFS